VQENTPDRYRDSIKVNRGILRSVRGTVLKIMRILLSVYEKVQLGLLYRKETNYQNTKLNINKAQLTHSLFLFRKSSLHFHNLKKAINFLTLLFIEHLVIKNANAFFGLPHPN
jgi:hypothetical protein